MKNQIQVIYLSKKYLLKFKNFIKINHSKTHILSKSDKFNLATLAPSPM